MPVLSVFMSFNSQPPEGGWTGGVQKIAGLNRFNSQPPEGGWSLDNPAAVSGVVSTHSRPKAAGNDFSSNLRAGNVSTHSRPKAAGRRVRILTPIPIRFNSQPPEGGWAFLTQNTANE